MPKSIVTAENAAKLSLCLTSLNVCSKLFGGWMSGSVSVIAEGMQSGVDVLVSYGVLKAIQVSAKPPDEEHPYGHGKAEVLLGAAQMVLILVTALFIVAQAALRLGKPEPIEVSWGFIVMLVSSAINLFLMASLSRAARHHKSAALRSEVLHLRGDLLASLGILVGLLLVWVTKWAILDPIVAILFMLVVVVQAIRQLLKFIHPLMDGALPAEERAKLVEVLKAHPESRGFHAVKTRQVGSERFVELHVLLDDHLTFVQAHDVAEEIEAELGDALGGATVTVHYEPYLAETEHQKLAHSDQPTTQ